MWAALFPGQGSQQIGMGQFLFDNFKTAKTLFEEASDTLSLDFKKLCFNGDEKELALTHNTQPALLLVSTCYSQVLQEVSPIDFKFTAGHSVGEYAALVHSKVLKFSDAIRAVRKRGQEMQSAVPVGQGGMVAVLGLDSEQVNKMILWSKEKSQLGPIECANFNSPGQIVISGDKQALDWLVSNLDKEIFSPAPRRLKLIPLKVSAPFHCSLMKPAQDAMQTFFEDIVFSNAETPVVQNTIASAETDPNNIKVNLTQQISSSVNWHPSIDWMSSQGVEKYLELGHGKVLSGLNLSLIHI